MKAFLLFATLIPFTTTAIAQVVFQSPLEAWTAGVPDGLFGARSDYPLAQLAMDTVNVHGGEQAMRLDLGILPEKKLTTGPLSVTSGQLYDIRFWVRGSGLVRTGLYDGRAEQDGYAPYNEVILVDDSVIWQLIISTVYAENTTDQAEFVFAVEGTADTSYLVIDDILIVHNALDPVIASIAQIQTTENPQGISPLNFQLVRTHGIVTGVGTSSYFIQDGEGAWNGIYVNAPPPEALAVGDSITVMATVQEVEGFDELWDYTLTQLIAVEHFIRHSTGHPSPEVPWVTAFDMEEERWEGVLVRIADLECQTLPGLPDFQWAASNWQGNTIVDDLLYRASPAIGTSYTITGIAHYTGYGKIEPRSANDIEIGVGVAETEEAALRIFPVPADDHFTLELGDRSDMTSYSVADATGRIVLADRIMQQRVTVNTAGLANGAYVLIVRNATTTLQRAVVVDH